MFCLKKNNELIKGYLAEALLNLMKEKDFKNITITEITQKAGVSRMTYYRYYCYKEDILDDYVTGIIEEYKKIREKIDKNDSYSLVKSAFDLFYEHQELIKALEKCNLSSIAQNKINEYITIFYPNYREELIEEYRLYILSGALYNVGKTWINKGLKEDSATISKIFVDKLYPKEKNLQ